MKLSGIRQSEIKGSLLACLGVPRFDTVGNLELVSPNIHTVCVFCFVAGSKFWHTGAFEVRKETSTEDCDNNNAVDVNISSDLGGTGEVQVHIINDGEDGRLIMLYCSRVALTFDNGNIWFYFCNISNV